MKSNVKELSAYPKLISKIRSYYPDLDENDVKSVDMRLWCILSGFSKEFSENLKTIRNRLNLNQTEMGKIFSVSTMGYAQWEKGICPPKISTLKETFDKLELFEPDEIISFNPFNNQSLAVKQIPIIPSKWFRGKTLESSSRLLPTFKAEKYISSSFLDGDYDFAIEIEDNSMMGNERSIPKGSIALCQNKSLLNKSNEDVFREVAGKVSVVGITSSSAEVRETFFNEKFLILRCWNYTLPEKMFPIDQKYLDDLSDEDLNKTKFLGYETFASSIQIHGIVKKIIFDL
jgi:transcriptional regulator with XRE-family HTH domain